MKTQNSEVLLEKLRSRLPDADERLMSARENSLAELDNYRRLRRALTRLTPMQREYLYEGLSALQATLADDDAELGVSLSFEGGPQVRILIEDLIAAAAHEDRELVAAG